MRSGARSFTSLNWRVGLGVFFLTFLATTSLQAQSISPLTVNAAGGYSQAADFSLAYSVGEQSSISF